MVAARPREGLSASTSKGVARETPSACAEHADLFSGALRQETCATGLDPPSAEELLSGRSWGSLSGGPGQFYELRAKAPQGPPSPAPFYDMDTCGGKYRSLVAHTADMPERYSLMQSRSDRRFRGEGGEMLGLFVSTPPNLGPGNYVGHREWKVHTNRGGRTRGQRSP
mmetsp:Transcript_8116/g.20282  ORF Transcript_8116/g.20282 Transcript_8116/m.20282 type:complete len:168 (-) Transcript_8116:140-643(-)